jgi:hypothetical protein
MSTVATTESVRTDLPIIGGALLANPAESVRVEFAAARPFPHVMIDLDLPRNLLTEFPAMDWRGWNAYGDGHQRE